MHNDQVLASYQKTIPATVAFAESAGLITPSRAGGVADASVRDTSTNEADPIWAAIRDEARQEERRGASLLLFLDKSVLEPTSLEDALARILSAKLNAEMLGEDRMRSLLWQAFQNAPQIQRSIRQDLQAIVDRDPVASGYLIPFVFFKGFQALQAYRVAHWYWNRNDHFLAAFLQNRISEVFGVDIHPAARIGSGILMDHATGIVVGETSVIEDNVSILHEVTLGGTGKETGDRHPKVRQGVLIGAGAKILGNVEIGEGAKIGAGSVVLDSVPPHCTVAGVPARIVARNCRANPALDMDQQFPHHFEDGSGI
ncbi:serine O-acetyltransferase [Schlesneria paludicola]|uniref:serine O-acetyltransferase n=1 Tax=Schlesneria paludicola TaxID=360056 RepID=UPI00029A17B9|nr:serine O-acetyltransferase [Schlesneria paludicola]